jgi:lipase chaperone LimK
MRRTRVALGAAACAAAALLAWHAGTPATPPAAAQAARALPAAPAQGAAPAPARAMDSSPFATRSQATATQEGGADPLLADGLRDTLEAMLLEAGETDDPAVLKQRLAALVGKHFPAAYAARALELAERYVDYRVALGQLHAPQDPADPTALREALQARLDVRRQFFSDAEHAALFAREDDLDRYTLARLEVQANTQLSPRQREQALRAAEAELPEDRRAARRASTAYLDVAAQTAAFDAQNADAYTRYAARQAQYGDAAAQALAQLDRQEQDWQQRLAEYSQAQAASRADSPGLAALRQRLFTPEEQLRLNAALALRAMHQ